MKTRHCLPLAAAFSLALSAACGAATIDVNSTADQPDADLLDGICDADLVQAGEQRTLRAAVQHSNATSEDDVIRLPIGTCRLTIKGAAEDQCATGDLDILDDVLIMGLAGVSGTTVDGRKAKDRVFDVHPGVHAVIMEMTIRKGRAPKGQGGGGIRNGGDLELHNLVITKCSSKDDAGALDQQQGTSTIEGVLFAMNKAKDDGGAIDVDGGTMDISTSTFKKNRTKNEGGALENSGNVVDVVNCTFSGNRAKDEGGALCVEDGGTLTLMNCTLTKNRAKKAWGISASDDYYGTNTVTTQNTIFADSKKKEITGTLTSAGGNLDIGTKCGFAAGDLSSTDPELRPLANNGGPTPTHALKPTSPAIDAGNDTGCPTADQRGLARVDIAGTGTALADTGAFEFQGP
ncbi:MAG: hypothetical protein HY812_13855 [Planctomycetes bacterium]|nr:hypothetical protein [Planctomycetota bacterium]